MYLICMNRLNQGAETDADEKVFIKALPILRIVELINLCRLKNQQDYTVT